MIYEKIKIGKKEISSRIVMPPVATYQSSDDGKVTEKMIDYYSKRAKNKNISLIITEHSYIDVSGKARANQMSISSDDDIYGLKKLVEAIHSENCLAIAQLNHAGSAAPRSVTGKNPVSASALILPKNPMMGDGKIPDELTKEGISELVKQFVEASKRARSAGFDGVEIHSAHAYLLDQFFSPLSNKRTDEYGGDLENRIRIHKEIIKAVKSEIGDMILSLRLGGIDDQDGGASIEDSVRASIEFEKLGVDMISISGGMCGYTRKNNNEPGYFKNVSDAIKKNVGIPVMLTGGVKSLDEAEMLLSQNVCDIVGIGRELLKNPDWEM